MMEAATYTLELAEMRRKADEAEPGRERWKLRHELCRRAVPNCDELLGGQKLAEVDLSALDVLYADLCESWDAPARERQSRGTREALDELDGLDVGKLAAMVDAMERLAASRQVFKGIR